METFEHFQGTRGRTCEGWYPHTQLAMPLQPPSIAVCNFLSYCRCAALAVCSRGMAKLPPALLGSALRAVSCFCWYFLLPVLSWILRLYFPGEVMNKFLILFMITLFEDLDKPSEHPELSLWQGEKRMVVEHFCGTQSQVLHEVLQNVILCLTGAWGINELNWHCTPVVHRLMSLTDSNTNDFPTKLPHSPNLLRADLRTFAAFRIPLNLTSWSHCRVITLCILEVAHVHMEKTCGEGVLCDVSALRNHILCHFWGRWSRKSMVGCIRYETQDLLSEGEFCNCEKWTMGVYPVRLDPVNPIKCCQAMMCSVSIKVQDP